MSDERLERLIGYARERMTTAPTQDERREAYEDMRWLISQRSPKQIARMEAHLPKPWGSLQ